MERRLTNVRQVEHVGIEGKTLLFKALAKTELGDFDVTGKTTVELVEKARELYKMAKKRGFI